VVRARGLLGGPAPGGIDPDFHEPALWSDLLADGSIVQRRVERPASGTEPATLLIDLYMALANPPRIGRNLLGDKTYTAITSELDPGDALILVAANGLYSFKGTAYARTGEFDRIRVVQDGRTFVLKSGGHHRLSALLDSSEAPEFREIGLFVVPAAEGFELAEPWSLELVLDLPQAGPGVLSSVEIPYRLPNEYLAAGEPAEPIRAGQNGTAPTGTRPATAPWDPARLEEMIKMVLLGLTGVIAGFVAFLGLMQRLR
jgi:transcriptional regulator of nitric oxide reductase